MSEQERDSPIVASLPVFLGELFTVHLSNERTSLAHDHIGMSSSDRKTQNSLHLPSLQSVESMLSTRNDCSTMNFRR